MPEVEDDMNVKIVISSDAPKLSSALIQLELEAFQLGLAYGIFSSSLKNPKTFTAVCDNFTHYLRSSLILANLVELSYEKYVIP